jgi:endonuclease/exonuclease/phosphatase family metal-dependent hydrolase
MRQRLLRWLCAIGLLGTVATLGTTPARAVTGGPYRIFQFNFCGNAPSCPVQGSTGAPVDALVASIAAYRPDLVTLDEMCQNQFDAVRSRLAIAGWSMTGQFQVTDTMPDLYCTDHRYGIGVLTRGASARPVSACLAFCQSPTWQEERRYVLCLRTTLLLPTQVCAVHVGNDGQDQQLGRLSAFLNRYPASMPVLLGGDLNLPPTSRSLSRLYLSRDDAPGGQFEEAAACSTRSGSGSQCNQPTLKGSPVKIDYVFGSAADHFDGMARVGSARYSDHVPLLASFRQCTAAAC